MNDLTYTYAFELKKIQRIKLFYIHLALYLAINAILLTVNLATNPAYLWFIWPLLFWTKGLVLHALSTFDKSTAATEEG
jgi:hypothetical protein